MLRLSGFALYSRWVPLIKMSLQVKKATVLSHYKKLMNIPLPTGPNRWPINPFGKAKD